ncbi:MAG: dihydrofolate reductase [Verrucomicrobia bacterium]|nr:dihydrofolate reductase [Verrucomicrobiota bacterium]
MPPLPFKAIAAMSLNRVIGSGNTIPWHLPDDFAWFKQTTMGHVLVMGRRTFESIGRPLPGRETVVLTRRAEPIPGVRTVGSLDAIGQADDLDGRTIFICGGAQVYAQALGQCSDLFLSLVKREVEGDAFFPEYEPMFDGGETLRESADFDIVHYRRLGQAGGD